MFFCGKVPQKLIYFRSLNMALKGLFPGISPSVLALSGFIVAFFFCERYGRPLGYLSSQNVTLQVKAVSSTKITSKHVEAVSTNSGLSGVSVLGVWPLI